MSLHCWEDSDDHAATCMLDAGHDGAHEWTPDAEIMVRFSPWPQPDNCPRCGGSGADPEHAGECGECKP